MKKIISLFLVLCVIFYFAACNSDKKTDEYIDNNINNSNSNKLSEPMFDNEASFSDEFTTNLNENIVENIDPDNNIIIENQNINIEDVKNAPETSAENFDIIESYDGTILIDKYHGDDEIVVIPEIINGKMVTIVSSCAFYHNSTIRAVKLADSIELIGPNAFSYAENLEIIIAGSGLEEINYNAFVNCPKLRYLELNDGLEYIHECIVGERPELKEFRSFAKIKEITIPSSVRVIEEYAFAYIESLEKVIFEGNVEVIYPDIFLECVNLKTIIVPSQEMKTELIQRDDIPDTCEIIVT